MIVWRFPPVILPILRYSQRQISPEIPASANSYHGYVSRQISSLPAVLNLWFPKRSVLRPRFIPMPHGFSTENCRLERNPKTYERWISDYLGKSTQTLTGAMIEFIGQMLRLLGNIPTGNTLLPKSPSNLRSMLDMLSDINRIVDLYLGYYSIAPIYLFTCLRQSA